MDTYVPINKCNKGLISTEFESVYKHIIYHLKPHPLFNSSGCSGLIGQGKLNFFQ